MKGDPTEIHASFSLEGTAARAEDTLSPTVTSFFMPELLVARDRAVELVLAGLLDLTSSDAFPPAVDEGASWPPCLRPRPPRSWGTLPSLCTLELLLARLEGGLALNAIEVFLLDDPRPALPAGAAPALGRRLSPSLGLPSRLPPPQLPRADARRAEPRDQDAERDQRDRRRSCDHTHGPRSALTGSPRA